MCSHMVHTLCHSAFSSMMSIARPTHKRYRAYTAAAAAAASNVERQQHAVCAISMLCVPVYKVSHVTCQFSNRYRFQSYALCARCTTLGARTLAISTATILIDETTTAKPNSIRLLLPMVSVWSCLCRLIWLAADVDADDETERE